MAEYIEREAVLDSLRKLSAGLKDILKGLKYIEETQICNAEILTVYECAMRVTEQPTADVVPVVRCKDCKHRGEQYLHGTANCNYHNTLIDCDDFCSYGERKNDNG